VTTAATPLQGRTQTGPACVAETVAAGRLPPLSFGDPANADSGEYATLTGLLADPASWRREFTNLRTRCSRRGRCFHARAETDAGRGNRNNR